jgi:hypothetical protein
LGAYSCPQLGNDRLAFYHLTKRDTYNGISVPLVVLVGNRTGSQSLLFAQNAIHHVPWNAVDGAGVSRRRIVLVLLSNGDDHAARLRNRVDRTSMFINSESTRRRKCGAQVMHGPRGRMGGLNLEVMTPGSVGGSREANYDRVSMRASSPSISRSSPASKQSSRSLSNIRCNAAWMLGYFIAARFANLAWGSRDRAGTGLSRLRSGCTPVAVVVRWIVRKALSVATM